MQPSDPLVGGAVIGRIQTEPCALRMDLWEEGSVIRASSGRDGPAQPVAPEASGPKAPSLPSFPPSLLWAQDAQTCPQSAGLPLLLLCVHRNGGPPGNPSSGYFQRRQRWVLSLPFCSSFLPLPLILCLIDQMSSNKTLRSADRTLGHLLDPMLAGTRLQTRLPTPSSWAGNGGTPLPTFSGLRLSPGPSKALRLQGQGPAWVPTLFTSSDCRGPGTPQRRTACFSGALEGGSGDLASGSMGLQCLISLCLSFLITLCPRAFWDAGRTAPLCQAPGAHSLSQLLRTASQGDGRGWGEHAVGPPDSHCQLL